MIHIKCSICNHKEYYKSTEQLFNAIKMFQTKKHTIICSDCLNRKREKNE